MKVLAISGSTRKESTNTALLRAIKCSTLDNIEIDIEIYQSIDQLPIFNQDLEGDKTPELVLDFCRKIDESDGILISCPEYVRSLPGGLKNAIDWLVSRQEIMAKPIALVHASHRGDDMLSSLKIILSTVSENFSEDIFLRIPLKSTACITVESVLEIPENVSQIDSFLVEFKHFIANV